MYKNPIKTVSGILAFSQRKTLLQVGDVSYYVRLPRTQKEYLDGDRVRARITKRADGSQLSEVQILSLEQRTQKTLLARIIPKNGKRYISVLSEFGYYETHLIQIPTDIEEDDVLHVRFALTGKLTIVGKFAKSSNFDYQEKLLFFLSGTRMDFSPQIEHEAERMQGEKEKTIQAALKKRRDFRGTFTFTIDGADAKDLDDAISIECDSNGNYILGVHIADVAEYVREDSYLDKEALKRATSIYTPGKVIPMLPEALSNDVCSLHPGEPKLVLSCLMTVDRTGHVLHTEIVEGIIDSGHRGVYEDIQNNYELRITNYEGGNKKDNSNILGLKNLQQAILLSYELYTILKNRRAKEGKILFDSVETVFDFPPHPTGMIVPTGVHTRTRVAAHMLIEEFMVLANEEVAKWCDAQGIPFLSRVHGLPSENALGIIRQIIATGGKTGQILQLNNIGSSELRQGGNTKKRTIEPIDIRRFLESLDSESLYRYSRLLLPKMAKAIYRDRPDRHFGLALEYYAHFTSPIRRYPDLQVHRIIKEKLRGTLTDARIIHYKKILGKVARQCSERERAAEDIERAFDSLYAVRYMAKYVGETFSGRVAGIAEFAYFVELDSGIEVTVYLPRMIRYRTDDITGILTDSRGKQVVQIGQKLQVQITGVMEDERRIVGEKL